MANLLLSLHILVHFYILTTTHLVCLPTDPAASAETLPPFTAAMMEAMRMRTVPKE